MLKNLKKYKLMNMAVMQLKKSHLFYKMITKTTQSYQSNNKVMLIVGNIFKS